MSALVRGLVCAGFLACPVLAHAEGAPPSPPVPSVVPSVVPPVRVYMRAEDGPLTFSARERSSHEAPAWCIAPCDMRLAPGDYRLKLNGVTADDSVSLRGPGTLRGAYHSREASRSAGWLALNVGGIIGGVFITVGALGGPTWAYFAGGGALTASGLLFVVTYRSDRATVSFTPAEPLDVRGMPAPPPSPGSAALGGAERTTFGSRARGLGFRVAF